MRICFAKFKNKYTNQIKNLTYIRSYFNFSSLVKEGRVFFIASSMSTCLISTRSSCLIVPYKKKLNKIL